MKNQCFFFLLAKMDEKQYRLGWRREHAAKTRQERLVTAYVKAKQPRLYNEAVEFYNTLHKKYPKKMDLRKVPEVQQLFFPAATSETRTYERMDYSDIQTSGRPSFNDNLQLRIQLLPSTTTPDQDQGTASTVHDMAEQPDQGTASTVHDTAEQPDQGTASTVHDTAEQPDQGTASTVHDTAEQPDQGTASTVHDTPEQPNTSVPEPGLFGEVTTPLDISDSVIYGIIEELQKDPQLNSFFDDLDIDIPDMSPLEQELFW